MKQRKKIITIMLSVILLWGMLPTAGYADTADEFVIDEEGVLTAYNGPGGSVTVPEDVLEIGAGVFKAEHNITEIILTANYISLKANALSECDQLTDVHFYGLYPYIDPAAFEGLDQVTIHGLTGSFAEEMADHLGFPFEPFPTLTHEATGISVQIRPYPNATLQVEPVTSGDDYDWIEEYEQKPFVAYQIQLMQGEDPIDTDWDDVVVTIPRPESFDKHVKVKQYQYGWAYILYTGDEDQMVCQTNGLGIFYVVPTPFAIDQYGTLYDYDGDGGDIVIDADVLTIGTGAFTKEDAITSVTIPGSVFEIQEKAFENCDTLTDVYVYGRSIEIDPDAFFGCDNVRFHGFSGSTVEKFAKEHDYEFEPFPTLTHEDTGISVQTRPNKDATLQVTTITQGEIYDLLSQELGPLGLSFVLYDIRLDIPADAETMVTIPRPEGFGKLNLVVQIVDYMPFPVYIGMDQNMVCPTQGLGLFAVINIPYQNGDIDLNGDVAVTDARILLQYAVGKIDIADYLMLVYDNVIEALNASIGLDLPGLDWGDISREEFRQMVEEMKETELFLFIENLVNGYLDVDSNGKINVTDARLTLQLAVGKISSI